MSRGSSRQPRLVNLPAYVERERHVLWLTLQYIGRLRMVTNPAALLKFLTTLNTFARAFSLHLKKEKKQDLSLDVAISKVKEVINFMQECLKNTTPLNLYILEEPTPHPLDLSRTSRQTDETGDIHAQSKGSSPITRVSPVYLLQPKKPIIAFVRTGFHSSEARPSPFYLACLEASRRSNEKNKKSISKIRELLSLFKV